ncbi:hypothetical protein VTK73DRAFT_1815 [Phialemonium thermophilum]|uniref:Uncharacterized protein n=1 Tax=Phialemonium thermophilum TaxID=223376 RepID=A0ABR3X850_9PEZI
MVTSILVAKTFVKATEARIGTGDDSAALTLMSADMERIRMGIHPLHEIWASVIQAALAGWMLYNRLGLVFLVPAGLAILCFLGLAVLVRFTGDSQRGWMALVQRRVGLTAMVVAGMKNLKLSGLSAPVGRFVQTLRIDELRAGSRFRRIMLAAAILGFMPMLVGPPLTFAFARRTLDVSRMFTSLSFLVLLTNPLTMIFQSLPSLVAGLACIGRVQAFLECETRQDFREVLADRRRSAEKAEAVASSSPESDPETAPPVLVRNGSFGWKADQFVLRGLNTRVPRGSLTLVVGRVGAGKSTFCKALLGEVPFHRGDIILSTRFAHIGFCEQPPFLTNGSVRDNIVGFSPFDHDRYAEVIRAAALDVDMATLPQGDRTNIGSDGIALSGGQKQRVSLARALYLQTDLLVLDDVFSGLDADTEEQVFRQVFGPDGLLRRRRSTVLLCTHSIRHLPAADHIIALGDGSIIEQGSFDELMTRPGYVQRLGLGGASDSDSSSQKSLSETRPQFLHRPATRSSDLFPDMNESRQVGDWSVYKHYFKSVGLLVTVTGVVTSALWGFLTNYATIWLTYWSDDVVSEHPSHSYHYYAGIYALLQVSAMLSLLSLGIAIFDVSVRNAGARLHRNALTTLIRAPLRFFSNTDTGVITNLFSQDLNLVDTELPNATLNTLYAVAQSLGQAAVMLTSSLYLGISYPLLVGLLYVVQKFYLRTSRQLRLLDLEAKSPLYTHFLDTLKGIVTLRAFGFIPDDIQKNLNLLDSSQRPAYLLLMIQEWLNLVLDVVVMVIAAALTTLAVRLRSDSAFTGASLYTLMSFTENLSTIVISYTKLETSIGAVSRLKTFDETVKPEDRSEEDIVPPEQWPDKGVVHLTGVSATYDKEEDENAQPNLALRDIRLLIGSGERIAICGRTGSGKSSLVALLLKLLDPLPGASAGEVFIDDTPLSRIDRTALRQRIIAVPQEAVFLPDGTTFKTNLDPSDVSAPEDCQAVLEAVGLWSFVQERGGLDAGMSAETLSAGQRQLLSLGRALLRRRVRARRPGLTTGGGGADSSSEGGILVLDEVSSSVDYETERVMQDIIRTEFERYTVIAVSHRLDMIMDFDRVVVMDKGEIVEVGKPTVLASRPGTRFGDLVKAGAK